MTPGGRTSKNLLRVGLIVVPALSYESAVRFGALDSFTFIPLSEMLRSMADLMTDDDFLADALIPSLTNIILAIAIAGVLGVLVGILLWKVEPLYKATQPYLLLYYAIPTFALYPLFIVLFGVGRTAIVSLAVLFAVVIVIANTALGLRGTRRVWVKVGDAMSLSPWQMFRHIYLPAAWPSIFTGLRLAVSYSVITVIATEFILATAGLGHEIAFAYNNFDIYTMYGAILLVVVAVVAINMMLSYLQSRIYSRELEGK